MSVSGSQDGSSAKALPPTLPPIGDPTAGAKFVVEARNEESDDYLDGSAYGQELGWDCREVDCSIPPHPSHVACEKKERADEDQPQ